MAEQYGVWTKGEAGELIPDLSCPTKLVVQQWLTSAKAPLQPWRASPPWELHPHTHLQALEPQSLPCPLQTGVEMAPHQPSYLGASLSFVGSAKPTPSFIESLQKCLAFLCFFFPVSILTNILAHQNLTVNEWYSQD